MNIESYPLTNAEIGMQNHARAIDGSDGSISAKQPLIFAVTRGCVVVRSAWANEVFWLSPRLSASRLRGIFAGNSLQMVSLNREAQPPRRVSDDVLEETPSDKSLASWTFLRDAARLFATFPFSHAGSRDH